MLCCAGKIRHISNPDHELETESLEIDNLNTDEPLEILGRSFKNFKKNNKNKSKGNKGNKIKFKGNKDSRQQTVDEEHSLEHSCCIVEEYGQYFDFEERECCWDGIPRLIGTCPEVLNF